MGNVPSPEPTGKPEAYEEAAVMAAHSILVEHDFASAANWSESTLVVLKAAKAAQRKLKGRGDLLHVLCSAFESRDDYYDYIHPYSELGEALMCLVAAVALMDAQRRLEDAAFAAETGETGETSAPEDIDAAIAALNPYVPLPKRRRKAKQKGPTT